MPNCVVPLCSSRKAWHRFPKATELRKKWLNALSLSSYTPNEFTRVCRLHFLKSDYVLTKESNRRKLTAHLKKNAVPSQYLHLSKTTNIKNGSRPFKKPDMINQITNKTMDKEIMVEHNNSSDLINVDVSSCKIKLERTSTDSFSTINYQNKLECRTCLQTFEYETELYDIFQPWSYPWDGMDITVAADLSKIAEIQIPSTDEHSKLICWPCYQRLNDACQFTTMVKRNDQYLHLRCMSTAATHCEIWPKPIQIDKSLDSIVMEVDIKQEVVSEPECENEQPNNLCPGNSSAGMEYLDIKEEPVDIVDPLPLKVTVNGSMTIDEFNALATGMVNGGNKSPESFPDNVIKEEPMSEAEENIIPDLPLECMLCSKVFNRVTGLKAHVIAQHSYKTVRRKTDGIVSPKKRNQTKYICETCQRVFYTSTDLMVHETCHDKFTCFGCNEKFDTFSQLGEHRIQCKAAPGNVLHKVKTLDDVLRMSNSPTAHEEDNANLHLLENGISPNFNEDLHSNINSVTEILKESLDSS